MAQLINFNLIDRILDSLRANNWENVFAVNEELDEKDWYETKKVAVSRSLRFVFSPSESETGQNKSELIFYHVLIELAFNFFNIVYSYIYSTIRFTSAQYLHFTNKAHVHTYAQVWVSELAFDWWSNITHTHTERGLTNAVKKYNTNKSLTCLKHGARFMEDE